MFRKENSKIYNFPVEAEFKFAPKGAQKGSTDPMKEVHRVGGRKEAGCWELDKVHRAGGGATESVEAGTEPMDVVLDDGLIDGISTDSVAGAIEPVRSELRGTPMELQGHRLGGPSTESVG